MPLTFGTFLEHAAAHLAREAERDELLGLMPPVLDSHIFWLDDDQEFQKHVHEIRSDLIPEMRERIHLPFADTTTVSVIRKPGQPPIWTLDRMIENPPYLEGLIKRSELSLDGGQRLLVVRYQLQEQVPIVEDPIMSWVIVYQGVQGNDVHFNFIPSVKLHIALESNLGRPSEEKWKTFQVESKVILDYAAALSHPENYIVSVTPELTPKEERKVASGRPRPAQKARHFIVVDHQVLVRMRGGNGTHASPVPHERRGHWRRISERCRHAKMMGLERVFVRPAMVGDPTWKHEKNFYEVLPDLGKVEK
jgi:hypothetical protein